MKKLILCLLPFLFISCTHDMSRKEIDEIDLVLVLGIDYEDGEYIISALYSTGGGADPEKGAGEGSEEIAQGRGKTAYEALEDLKLKNKKALTLAQTGSYLIGEDAAEEGLKQCIDFLSRDETIKMEALIYVIKDESAYDFINGAVENEQIIHEDLEAIKQKQKELLTRNDNTMVNILNDMRQSYTGVLLPYLLAEESGFIIEGYAVFDQLKLKDYLDRETSDGVNFIKNIMRSYPIYLEDQVSLMASYTKTDLKTDIKDKRITVTIKVSFETMMKEILTDRDIFRPEELERLTREQNDYVKEILKKATHYSSSSSLDILNLARLVENQNLSEWKKLKEQWKEKLSEIRYEYELESRITKSFILGNK